MLMVGISAWADNTVKYSTDGGSTWTEAADLNALNVATTGVFASATTDIQVQLLDDQTLTGRLTWGKAYTLTITATKDVTIKGPTNAMWLLANFSNAKLIVGSSDHSITLDGENKSCQQGLPDGRQQRGPRVPEYSVWQWRNNRCGGSDSTACRGRRLLHPERTAHHEPDARTVYSEWQESSCEIISKEAPTYEESKRF